MLLIGDGHKVKGKTPTDRIDRLEKTIKEQAAQIAKLTRDFEELRQELQDNKTTW